MAFSEDATFVHTTTSDAQFRAWAQAIHDRLTAIGLINTADTGQINLATVLAPAVNTDAGFEIWRFSDAAQATDPIFLKLSYGKAGQTQRGRLTLQVGTGSNGTGTLTNPGTARIITPTIDPNGNGYIGACFRDGGFALIVAPDMATAAQTQFICFVVERLRNPDDLSLIAGAFVQVSGSSFPGTTDVRVAGAWQTGQHGFALAGSVSASGKVAFGRYQPAPVQIPAAPLRSMMFANPATVGAGDSGDVTIAGAAKTYKRPNGNIVTAIFSTPTSTTVQQNPIIAAS